MGFSDTFRSLQSRFITVSNSARVLYDIYTQHTAARWIVCGVFVLAYYFRVFLFNVRKILKKLRLIYY